MKRSHFAATVGAAVALTSCTNDFNPELGRTLTTKRAIAVLNAACPFGGEQSQSGFDTNRNGRLDASEIQNTSTQCFDADHAGVNKALRDVVTQQQLTLDPIGARDIPSINEPLAQLGMQLFFTKGLGGDLDAACVSCHHPFLGGGDDLSLPIGVAAVNHDLLGPGRQHDATAFHFDGGPTVPRNAPTTFNIALWDSVLFHDGRVEALVPVAGAEGAANGIRTPDVAFGQPDPSAPDNLTVAQARFPVTSPEEMRGFVYAAGESRDALRAQLQARFDGSAAPSELPQNEWLTAFQKGFDAPTGTSSELITFENITRAIAAYERSQVFVNNSFRQFIDGDDEAMAGTAKLGALLFYGKAGCSGCHSGDFMTDEDFHVIAMPQVGRGKGDSVDNGLNTDSDFGRFRETGDAADRFAFRTPSLLNVAETGPWGHAGAHTSLETVIRHHLDPAGALAAYDFAQLDPTVQVANFQANNDAAIEQLQALRNNGQSALPEISLTIEEVSWLEKFLLSLTDPCLTEAACIGQWVPQQNLDDPDGLRVFAIDATGQALAP